MASLAGGLKMQAAQPLLLEQPETDL